MKELLVVSILLGCGSGGGTPRPDASADAPPDAVISPDPEPDPAVTACTSPIALPSLPAISQPWPAAVAVADFNEDGKQDFVVLQGAPAGMSGAVIVYAGNGAGGFTKSSPMATTPSISMTAGDLDGDTHLDLLLIPSGYAPSSVMSVLLGAGNGTFAAPVTYAVPAGAESVTLGDLDGDTKLDAIVASSSVGVTILRGNGDGTLQTGSDLASMPSVKRIVAARLDGDTDIDLALTLAYTHTVRVLPGNGNGTFGTAVDIDAGYEVNGLAAGDFDEDGDLDLVAGWSWNGALPSEAHILTNDGSGAFALGTAAFSVPLREVEAVDVDGDANLDIVSLNGVFHGGGDGTFPQQTILGSATNYPSAVGVGSFDGDSTKDFLLVRENDGLISLVRGGSAAQPMDDLYTQQGGWTSALAIADFNGDGKGDIAVLNYFLNPDLTPGTIAVLLANGTGYDAPVAYDAGYAATSLIVTDFNQDGRPDLAAAHGPFGFGSGVTVLINTGSSFTRTDYPGGNNTSWAVAGDFDRDGILDILRASGLGVLVMRGAGDGTFTDSVSSSVPADRVAAGDLDNDGDLDLVTSTIADLRVALNNGDGTFVDTMSLKVAVGAATAVIRDLDHDGDADIVVRTASRIMTFRNKGSGTFDDLDAIVLEPSATSGEVPLSLQLVDIDGDGSRDIVTSYSQRWAIAVLRGNGDATFGTPLDYPSAGQFARAGHLDADQHLDVVSAGGGIVRIHPNTCAP